MATERLRHSTDPCIGKLTKASHFSATFLWIPRASEPIIKARGPVRSCSYIVCEFASPVPTIVTPISLSLVMTWFRLLTWIKGILSAAPQEMRLTVSVRPALFLRGVITISTPAASAERRHAPRLCAS